MLPMTTFILLCSLCTFTLNICREEGNRLELFERFLIPRHIYAFSTFSFPYKKTKKKKIRVCSLDNLALYWPKSSLSGVLRKLFKNYSYLKLQSQIFRNLKKNDACHLLYLLYSYCFYLLKTIQRKVKYNIGVTLKFLCYFLRDILLQQN